MADCYFHGISSPGPCPGCKANESAGRDWWNDGPPKKPDKNDSKKKN